jgi:hypothetical protein
MVEEKEEEDAGMDVSLIVNLLQSQVAGQYSFRIS